MIKCGLRYWYGVPDQLVFKVKLSWDWGIRVQEGWWTFSIKGNKENIFIFVVYVQSQSHSLPGVGSAPTGDVTSILISSCRYNHVPSAVLHVWGRRKSREVLGCRRAALYSVFFTYGGQSPFVICVGNTCFSCADWPFMLFGIEVNST